MPELLVGDEAEATVALMLVRGGIHAVVGTRALVTGGQVGDQRIVGALAGHLDALHEKAGEPPGDRLDLAPQAGNEAERGPAGEHFREIHDGNYLGKDPEVDRFRIPDALSWREDSSGASRGSRTCEAQGGAPCAL